MNMWIQSLDMRVLSVLVSSRTDALTHAMVLVSTLGEWTVILFVSCVIALGLYLKRMRGEAAGLLLATAGSAAADLVIKTIVARPRPDIAFRAVAESGPSFPSAHATLAVAFFGFLAYLIIRDNSRLKVMPIALGALVCGIIGLSRLYLGVHYFSDVIGGYALGGLFVWIGIRTERWLRQRATS